MWKVKPNCGEKNLQQNQNKTSEIEKPKVSLRTRKTETKFETKKLREKKTRKEIGNLGTENLKKKQQNGTGKRKLGAGYF